MLTWEEKHWNWKKKITKVSKESYIYCLKIYSSVMGYIWSIKEEASAKDLLDF